MCLMFGVKMIESQKKSFLEKQSLKHYGGPCIALQRFVTQLTGAHNITVLSISLVPNA